MKPAPATITLSPENSRSVTKLAALFGWTPGKLVNHLLAETLEEFANINSGSLEGFLGAFYYPDQESARRALGRVTQITRASSTVVCRNRSKAKFLAPITKTMAGFTELPKGVRLKSRPYLPRIHRRTVRLDHSIEFSNNGLKLPFSECVFTGQGVVLKRRNDIKLKTIALRKKLHLERTAA